MERNELLEYSRDSWAESAKHDKFQALGSFGCAAAGILAAGIGVGLTLSKHPEGLFLAAAGLGSAAHFAKDGIDEMQSFAAMTAKAEIRQKELDTMSALPQEV